MDSWYRTFAYITGSLVFGLLFIIFTNSFLTYVNNPDWIGYAALFGYGLIFLNLSYGLNRRFTKKLKRASNISYVISALLVLPTLVWIYTKETALAESRLMFTLTIVFAVYLGAYFGIGAGTRRRLDYLNKLREQEDGLPDNLQRPHDDMNRN